MPTIAYLRVSSEDQNEARQREAIAQATNIEEDHHWFTDKASGKNTDRPAFEAMMKFVRRGDVLVVHSTDRLARSLVDLERIVSTLTARGVAVRFLREGQEYTGDDAPTAVLMRQMMAAFAQFERAMIRERQREGIALAKAAGKYRGSEPKLSDEQASELRRLVAEGVPKARVADRLGVSRGSVYSYLRRSEAQAPSAVAP
ncbi:recombinase family protein [Variovorax sp. LjRoot130]|uniref:recombinase family protein n=1 Tax=Variovorax sp. LjRoot130 TaxID=3342261 RepID=UPI003ECFF98B